jgi:hypothetical protein
MELVAARPFKFAGAQLKVGERVVGVNGELPGGRVLKQLVARSWVSLVDGGSVAAGRGAPVNQAAERRRARGRDMEVSA